MIVEENETRFAALLHQYEEWLGGPGYEGVRRLYAGWLKALAELPIYEPGDPGRVVPGSHAYEGCQTVAELLKVVIARNTQHTLEDFRSRAVESVWIEQTYDYITGDLCRDWIEAHKEQVLAIMGPQWADLSDDSLRLWECFMESGELEVNAEIVQEAIDTISQWSFDELRAAEGVCPLSKELLVSKLIY